jgi:hypothetical protein
MACPGRGASRSDATQNRGLSFLFDFAWVPVLRSSARAPHRARDTGRVSFRLTCQTAHTNPHSRGANHVRVMAPGTSSKQRGRRECRVRDAPIASHATKKAYEFQSPQVRRHQPAFPARWFYGFLRARPGDRALLSPSQVAMRKHCHQLDISVGMSGPHDFAVRLQSRSSSDLPTSTAFHAQRS